ncbi:BgTH12-06711 [Blumeria graminis f. sp. triticale]|uniref:BgTH12-06711 n=1 Tax=Blumeria graminis f. sp. triticale TaxID=1689686 RepID=A0A9W4DJR1_BLUGR|nr:BgTH12-06711 [Blumeria graminis f. sp. triticale]
MLNGPSNWDQWISTIQKFALTQSIWAQIDPSSISRVPCLKYPEEPLITVVKPTARLITDLAIDELRIYEFLYNRYRTELQAYKDQQRSLAFIQEFIIKTVGNYYSTISDEHDVASELVLLKRRLQPSGWVQQKEILSKYQFILNSPDRTDITAWVTNWQKVFTDAKRIGLPEAQGLRPTQSFLESICRIDNSFSDYWTNKLEDEARSNLQGWEERFPDGIEISEIFERTQATKAANTSLNQASFAVYKGQNSTLNTQPESFTSSNDPCTSGPSSKKPACPCGWKHYFSECYYINKALRPNNFKPSLERQQKVDDFLKVPSNNAKVNAALKKANNFRQKQNSESYESSGQNLPSIQAVAAASTASTFSQPSLNCSNYPLKNSFILDSGSDGHICNEFSRFSNYFSKPSTAVAGSGQFDILGYGTVFMKISTGLFQLNNVAYIPSFHTSLASLTRLQSAGISWNPQTGCIFNSEKTICFTKKLYNQYVIEYNKFEPVITESSFSTKGSDIKSVTPTDITIWHERLGHPSSQVLEKVLKNNSILPSEIKKELENCEPCKLAKAKRVVAFLVKDDYTKLILFYALSNSSAQELVGCIGNVQRFVKTQFSLDICVVHRDNDVSLQQEYQNFISDHGILDEPTAPYTPAQNGSAERSGGVISSKARTMRISSNLPQFLWPEIWKTAVFIYNRLPHRDSRLMSASTVLSSAQIEIDKKSWISPTEKMVILLQKNQQRAPSISTDLSVHHTYG